MKQSDPTEPLEGIAIIGMSGRFPGAGSVDEFWRNIKSGVESISRFSDEELSSEGIGRETLRDPGYVNAGGVLEDVELFDASFFGFTPREAEMMDPQHRLFLECAWGVLENVGYDPGLYQGLIGVYAGVSLNTYLLNNLLSNLDLKEAAASVQTVIGNDKDHVPARVSYKFNLKGPSVCVQTACSSSLVAVHLACQGLLSGDCDMALAGGVSIAVPIKAGYFYQEGGIYSPDGCCRAFDAKAQGTVGGNGVGIVVLKRLEDALADGDCIHAVIKGSAINNDGSLKVGYTAPSVDGQADVIAMAQAMAGVKPETVTYIEAHGTGTPLGDPIEIAALTQAFRAGADKKGWCAIGSVKTNIGHLDAAAGVAGLIKTVFALKHKKLPPSLHFESPNPKIDFAGGPFYVNTELSDWGADETPRRAGVSSFGMGGTNAHVVLEQAPTREISSEPRPFKLLVLSAKTITALESATTNLAEHLKGHPDLNLADAAFTLQLGRKGFGHRRMLVCRDLGDALAALEPLDPKRVFTHFQEPADQPVAFMFPGQGAQYVNMGLELYQTESVFRGHVDHCSELLKPRLGVDLRKLLYLSEDRTEASVHQMGQTSIAQPALFVVEYALAQLWMAWGVHPQAMIGHSIGEYVAACLAGVYSLEDALALIAARGQLIQHLPAGAMLAVPLPTQEVESLLGEHLSLAAVNGPALSVVSGPTDAVDRLEAQLAEKGLAPRRLHTSHAFHSKMMDPILDSFAEKLGSIDLSPPKIPYLSNVSGTWITATEATNPNYWVRHLRQTVRFSTGVQALLETPNTILLEVGPGRTLESLARRHPEKAADQIVLSSMRHPDHQSSDAAFLLDALGRLWLAGAPVDWLGFYAHERRGRLPLPTYPFERQRYWIEPQNQARGSTPRHRSPDKKPNIADWFYLPSWKRTAPPVLATDLADQRACWLVFSDPCGLGPQMVKRLEQEGQDVITVVAGERFAKLDERKYTINPRQRDGYDALFNELTALDKVPQKIVHLWSVGPNNTTPSGIELFEEMQYAGLYSLLFLAQAFGELDLPGPIQFWVVSSNLHDVTGEEVLRPERATLLGPCKVMPQEYPNITCRSIDVVLPKSRTRQEEQLIDQLLTEISAKSSDLVVAYRGPHRWLQHFEAIRLEGESKRPPRLREKGVYIITGGLGNVGLMLAEYLARTLQAKLVLTGRSGLPARKEWDQRLAIDGQTDPLIRKLDKEGVQTGHRVIKDMEEEVDSINQLEEKIQKKLGIRGIRDYPGLEQALNILCSSYIYSYLKINGINVAKGKIYRRSVLRDTLRIVPKFEKLFDLMINTLAEDNILNIKDNLIEFVIDKNKVEDPTILRKKADNEYPGFRGLFEILEHCVKNYSQALTGEIEAISVLYPDGSSYLINHSAETTVEHSQSRTYLTLVCEIVFNLVKRAQDKKLRILEVGAGDGILTRAMTTVLENQNIEYHFTDVGKSFVINAEKEASEKGFDFMKFGILDISKDPTEQGYERHGFDIILGLDVVHATKSIEETVGHLRQLLVPNGIMFLIEAVKIERWINMTTGLAEGWWYFNDDVRSDSPLLRLGEWEQVLQKQGFRSVRAYPQDERKREETDHGLIIAQQAVEVVANSYSNRIPGVDLDKEHRVRNAIRKVQELEALGSEVLVIQADVAELKEMQAVITQVHERFGGINGVIHAAGHTVREDNSLIQETDPKECKAHFRPKVNGLFVLEKVLHEESLDFFVSLSSNVSVLGGLKSVAYTSANLFMDAFAHRQYITEDVPWISTNWDRWSSLEETKPEETAFGRSLAQFAMTPGECVEAFQRILSVEGVPQVVISAGDLQARIDQWLNLKPLQDTSQAKQVKSSSLYARPVLRNKYVAPGSVAEQSLAEIWAESLGIEQVGIHDNFFELGGDSILSLQIITKANQAGLRFTSKQIFEHQTIAELARVAGTTRLLAAEQGLVTGPVPLTPIQHWFFEQSFLDLPHFSLSYMFEVQSGLDLALLERVVQQLVAHHDALRLRFVKEESGWQQITAGTDAVVPIARIDLSEMTEAEQGPALEAAVTELSQDNLNLAQGPIMRVALFDLGVHRPSRLLWTIHHLVVDAVSWRILLEDFQTGLGQLSGGETIQLPPKTISFKHWAERLAEYAQSETARRELDYWLSLPWARNSSLPVDYPKGANSGASARTVSVTLSVEETHVLLHDVPKVFNTQTSDLLLTAWAQACSQWIGTRSLLVDLEGHGREGVLEDMDLSRTVGWFTTLYPMLLDSGEHTDPAEVLKSIKEQLRRVPHQGIGYGLLGHLCTDEEIAEKIRDLPQAQLIFSYLGQVDQVLPESAPFGLVREFSESAGSVHQDRIHLLEIAGFIRTECLQLDWTYSENLHRRATIERLAQGFMEALRTLIAHCQSSDAGGYTPSDFPEVDLSQKELDQFIGRITRERR